MSKCDYISYLMIRCSIGYGIPGQGDTAKVLISVELICNFAELVIAHTHGLKL